MAGKYRQILIMVLTVAFLIFSAGSAFAERKMPPVLDKIKADMNSLLVSIDKDLSAAAKNLGKTGLNSQGARDELKKLCSRHSFIIDCCTVDAEGKIIAVEPALYKASQGKDISKQEQIIRIRKTKKPVMSKLFFAIEGMDALDYEFPVFDGKGKFIGSVSILIDSEKMFTGIIEPVGKGVPADFWVIQTDGRLLYDPDREEIGRSMLTDPVYTSHSMLIKAVKKIVSTSEGKFSFDFKGLDVSKPAQIEAQWTTVLCQGTPWRIVASHARKGDAKLGIRTLSNLGILKADESLKKLAANPEFTDAVVSADKETILKFFKKFFDSNKGIYAIQWVDNNMVNRFGYPEENSLQNYDFKKPDAISSKRTIEAIKTRGEASYEEPLMEGRKGNFFMVPLFRKSEYLGAIYYIIIAKPGE
jgi:hypothetical protein